MVNKKKAIVLFSGGNDSATTLILARSEGFECIALTLNYNQRHSYEIKASENFLKDYTDIEHITFNIDLSHIGGSALTDTDISLRGGVCFLRLQNIIPPINLRPMMVYLD